MRREEMGARRMSAALSKLLINTKSNRRHLGLCILTATMRLVYMQKSDWQYWGRICSAGSNWWLWHLR